MKWATEAVAQDQTTPLRVLSSTFLLDGREESDILKAIEQLSA